MLQSTVSWLAGRWQIQEVVLWTHAKNLASQRAAERAGFRYQPQRDELRTAGDATWPARWYSRPARRAADE